MSIGYLSVRSLGCVYLVHRLVWALHYGQWPTFQIDHINGIKTDNRIINLRDVTCAVNQRNKVMRSNNVSGFTGVYWNKKSRKWQAAVRINSKGFNLGGYDDIKDAIAARQRANDRLGFSPRHGKDMVHLQNT